MLFSFSHALVIVTLIASSTLSVNANRCKKMKKIFPGGKKDDKYMVEMMWNDAFVVEEDEDKGYTMWFDKKLDVNPNDAVTQNIFGGKDDFKDVEQCHLQYFHKELATVEEKLSVCKPWRDKKGCCLNKYVKSVNAIKTAYGKKYMWDRCGKLSNKCEKFFVEEACFYECEPAAGLYRKHMDPETHPEWARHEHEIDGEPNEWQMYKMPIKKSYSDAWFEACKDDYFCASGGFFDCAKAYDAVNPVCEDTPSKKPDEKEYTCADLAQKTESLTKRCDKSNVIGACPETCEGKCKCTDSRDARYDIKSKTFSCKDLSKMSSTRRAYHCGETNALVVCNATCEGWCEKKDFKKQ